MTDMQRYFVIIFCVTLLDCMVVIAYGETRTPMWAIVITSLVITALTWKPKGDV